MREEKNYWVAFSAFPQIGPKRFSLLRKYFGSAKRAWEAKKETLLKIGFSEKLVFDFIKFREGFDLSSYFLRMEKLQIRAITFEDKEYPESLKSTADRPFLLYLIGEIKPQDSLALGVVGTRKITSYGREVTETLVTNLAAFSLTIVSGLAYGVDSVAHNAAIESGGRTIGVWAGGLDSVFPGYRKNLVEKIIKNKKGAVISEYPLGFSPRVSTFPQRNRIIAGLSLGVLVTEAAEDSGSLITAKFCQKLKRPVFAVPGPITSSLSGGTAKLLKEGAKLVYNVKDILNELKIEQKVKIQEARKILPDDKNEEMILKILEREPKSVDQIVRESKRETGEVVAILALMEIKGKIKDLGGAVYAVC